MNHNRVIWVQAGHNNALQDIPVSMENVKRLRTRIRRPSVLDLMQITSLFATHIAMARRSQHREANSFSLRLRIISQSLFWDGVIPRLSLVLISSISVRRLSILSPIVLWRIAGPYTRHVRFPFSPNPFGDAHLQFVPVHKSGRITRAGRSGVIAIGTTKLGRDISNTLC
jgi:hypothetical protein